MEIVEVRHAQNDSWIDALDRARGSAGLHHGARVSGAEATSHGHHRQDASARLPLDAGYVRAPLASQATVPPTLHSRSEVGSGG